VISIGGRHYSAAAAWLNIAVMPKDNAASANPLLRVRMDTPRPRGIDFAGKLLCLHR
jgi:hypothetical protein